MTRMAILLLAILLTGTAAGSEVTVVLPELAGDYETSWRLPDVGPVERNVTFTIPPDVVSIEQMRLVISGTWTEGAILCDGDISPTPFIPTIELYITTPTVSYPDYFRGHRQPPAGSFQNLDIDIESSHPPGHLDFDVLLGTEIDLNLSCGIILVGLCSVVSDSYGTLSDVRLEILGSLAEDGKTWGQVKTLYK